LLDAIAGRVQALRQGAYAQEQARIQAGPRIVSELGHAGLRNVPYDRTSTIPRTTQIADHYRGNVMGSLANQGGVYDPNLPPGTPGNTLLGTNIPDAFRNAISGSPLFQQISTQAAINSGHIPPQEPWPAPSFPPVVAEPAPYNPDAPIGPGNVSPGAPGTGTYYGQQFGPPQTTGVLPGTSPPYQTSPHYLPNLPPSMQY
jgi:hypothetical protein